MTELLTEGEDNIYGTQEAAVEAAQVSDLAKQDLDFLAAMCLPEVYKYAFPAIYQAMWAWMCEQIHKGRDFSQLAIGLPRGFAKTLLIKLFIVYTILFTRRQFILVISENEEKAISIISDVSDILDEPNIKAAFGDWNLGKVTDQKAKKVFGFRGRNILLKAAGAGTGIRGITEKNVRPDLMIFDDIQSREDAESEVLSSNLEKWMIGTAMKTKSPEGCLFVFIANMYPTKGSLLRRLKTNDNWVKFIVGGITDAGQSLWEDLQPIRQLIKEFQNDLAAGHPEIFYAEVLNDENATVNNLVDLSTIPEYRYKPDDICQGKYLIIDPSNDKVGSDLVSIGYFEVWDGYPYLTELVEDRLSPADTIREAIKLCLRNSVSIVAIESNAYQYSLNYWFAFICEQMGIQGIQPVEVYSGSSSKNSRILGMFRMLPKGEVGLHPRVRPAVFMQVSQFNPLRRDNTDGLLDLLTYAPKVLELYGTEILNSNIVAEQESLALEVIHDNSPF
jgi:hypothetical protein